VPDIVDPDIEAYASEHTTPHPPYLDEAAEVTRSELGPLAQMMVGTLEGRFLEMLVAVSGATRVLEIGTFTGYSSISMAAGLPPGGSIVSCEVSERHAELARKHIAASPYADRIEVRLGPALETIAALEGSFDFVFIDADKGNYLNYYEAVLPRLSERGFIAADNTLWSGRVLTDGDADTAAIKAFNDRVAADERVVCVQLTVRDGVTLIRPRR
jgi:caffeoyl-CoA O-methyltransferase